VSPADGAAVAGTVGGGMGGSILGPLLAFGLVVALIPLALWLLKRSPIGSGMGNAGGGGAMRVVGALPLAPNQRVVTVEVGSGDDRRWLVLGVTPAGISTLHTLAPQADSPATGGSAALRSPFAQLLARQRRGAGDAR
jgi:flagellar protein FliO/FliZ